MANSLITPPEIERDNRSGPEVSPVGRTSHGNSELHLGGEDLAATEQGVFASLGSSIRDAFFPAKLPPLVLKSRPVAVVDRMAVKRDPVSTAIAVVLHIAVIGLLIFFAAKKYAEITTPKQTLTKVALDAPPPLLPRKAVVMGGGGGQKGPAPVSKGSPPKFSPLQITPPKAPPMLPPKLAVAPTIDVDTHLKMQTNMPTIGMANAPTVGISMGNGNGSGLGSGNGNGMGPGSDKGFGGGAYQVGGGVSEPKIIYQAEAEFSDEARKAKYQANPVVEMVIDENGTVIRARVIKGVGMGLDEEAVKAAKLYRFKPGFKDGKPVKVVVNLEIDFHIY